MKLIDFYGYVYNSSNFFDAWAPSGSARLARDAGRLSPEINLINNIKFVVLSFDLQQEIVFYLP